MGVKKIEFPRLTKEFVNSINEKLEEAKETLRVGTDLVTKGKTKTLTFYSADVESGKRTTLYKRTYEVKNPADFLSTDVSYILYRELFYNAFAFYSVNMTSLIEQQEAEKAIEDITKQKNAEQPKTADEAFMNVVSDE